MATRLAILLLALLWCGAPAKADTYYYRDKNGPIVTNLGNGEFQIDYLTYDYWGEDDFIDYMDVYVVQQGAKHLLFTHRGNHGYDEGYYNNGYGTITAVGDGVTWQSVSTRCEDDLRFRVLKFTLPECYWGSYNLEVRGRFKYSRYDSNPLDFSYSLPTYNLGAPRFTHSPVIDELIYENDDKVRIKVTELPRVPFSTNTLTFYMDDKVIDTDITTYDNEHGYVWMEKLVTMGDLDASKEHTFKVTSEVAFGLNSNVATTSKSRGPFASAANLKGEFNPVKRCVTLTWELDNKENDALNQTSVQRRIYGYNSWAEVARISKRCTQYVDEDVSATGLQAGKRYEYRVIPLPQKRTSNLPEFNWENINKFDITLKPELDIDITGTRAPHGAIINWEIPHSTEFEGCQVNVWRTTASGTDKTLLAQVPYGNQGKGSYTDEDISGVFKYYVTLDATSSWYACEFTSDKVQVQTIESATVRDLRISKGEYAGLVHMEWDVTNVSPLSGGTPERTTYTVWRRSLESETSEFTRIHTLSSNDEYIIYEDKNVLPGIYYEYRLDALAVANDEDATQVLTSTGGVGFSQSSGKITGTISYGTGTAVAGVDVVATPAGGASDMTSSRCLDFSGSGEALISCTPEKLNTLFNNARGFTMQMWINPGASASGSYLLANIGNFWGLYLTPAADGTFTLTHAVMTDGTTTESAELLAGIPAETYSHLTLTCRDGSFTTMLQTPGDGDEMHTLTNQVQVHASGEATAATTFCLGGTYKGQIDDFRLWSRALSTDEVADNYNRSLTGAESSLEIYWRFDEGLDDMFFDSSRRGTILNGNHGRLTAGVVSSSLVPPAKYLAYRGVTDADGNYMIDGIPFAGEGTSYSIEPTLGVHEFKPNKLLRYVGANSLVHNVTDFTDVSSFPVSGTVYYANTTYPVADCNFYVDGVIASRDGKMVTTAEDGTFTIDVPIGEHHIQVRKEGHTFISEGRYPADPDNVGARLTFDREITGLTFEDLTLVNFAGRVTGGTIEGNKPVGFGQSINTIGQARISLVPKDERYRLNVTKQVTGSSVEYVTNQEELPCEAVQGTLGSIQSNARRGAGEENRNRIFIDTDPATGEFSAQVPPLRYVVESVKVLKSGTEVGQSMNLDLSNPLVQLADSVVVDGQKHRYQFQKAVKFTHRTTPTIVVADKNAASGAFGVKEYKGRDDYGDFYVNDVYTVADDGTVTYPYGHPVFVSGNPYVFTITGFEEYVNNDRENVPVSYRVPLKDVEITVSNELSAIQEVYYEGDNAGKLGDSTKQTVKLGEDGTAHYTWRGGLPNISAPYTRNITMSYTIDGKTHTWGGADMECFLFGELPTGANFVTEGPDHVDMVLRDPPGSHSKAEWTKGSVTTTTRYKGSFGSIEDRTTNTTRFGLSVKIGTGVGLMKIEESEAAADMVNGVKITHNQENSSTTTRTVTATRTISTSDAPEFVGSMADIYVGASTNLTFGDARQIDFHREDSQSKPKVSRKDVVTTGVTFGTNFAYTQFFVENTLLPNFQKLIESKLTYADEGTIASYTHTGNDVVYLTPLRKGDRGYGSANDDKEIWGADAKNQMAGPSYWMFAPDDDRMHTDSIAWLNQQIANWKKIIAANEEDKVRAYHHEKSRYLIRNLSFDGGASVSYSEQNDSTYSTQQDLSNAYYGILGAKSGYTWNKVGIVVETENEGGGGNHWVDTDEKGESATFSYTMAEGDWDALTVDIMKSPRKWSPIFHTRAGQTSAPYEGEERTKYYAPGIYTLQEATMQMEVPRISVENPVATDVPVGGSATYKLRLSNESECDYDFYFLLLVDDDSNPDGAALKLDGQPLTNGRRIKVPAGEVLTKTLQLAQAQPGVLDYEGIRLVLASEAQSDPTSTMAVIADTCSIAAHFVPSSSEVTLKVPTRVVNTVTGTALPLSFDGFDRTYTGLKAFRVQYRLQGSPAWTLEREYVLSEDLLDGNNTLLPEGGSVPVQIETKDWADGEYLLRVLSVSSYGGAEVKRSSEEVAVTKDVARPAPIGVPTPSAGVLSAGDELSVTFNEDLLTGAITGTECITVRGRLNDAPVTHDGVFFSSGGQGAVTRSAVDLSTGSFSVGFWLKWSGEGSLLRHGTAGNNMDLSVDADGHLLVSMCGTLHTSAAILEPGKWNYVNVAYNADAGTLSAQYAVNSLTGTLFDKEPVGAYTGNGAITLGRGLTGSIHELTLWNRVRSLSTALADIHTVKSPTTEGLIGYWRLDEGCGTEGTDLARSRHMTLPDGNAWSLESKNVGVTLDGASFVNIDVTRVNTAPAQDYMLEFWCRGRKNDDGTPATIFSLSNGSLALLSDARGLLLRADGADYPVTSAQPLDGDWHHVALNVLRGSAGTGTLYLDGNAVAQYPSDYFPAFAAASLTLGATRADASDEAYGSFMEGSFDEVRLWHATMGAETIRSRMRTKASQDALGLVAYYPFESSSLDSYGQQVTAPDLSDRSTSAAPAARVLAPREGYMAVVTEWSTEAVPAIKGTPELQDVRFSFVASDRKLLINLEESASRVEGCSLEVNVHSVQDLHGNFSQPVSWTALVNRNRLLWADDAKTLVKEGGEDLTFTAQVVNNGADKADWSLASLPTWLEADRLSGSLLPLTSATVTFTVPSSVAVGRYETAVALTGAEGLTSNMVVSLSVVGEKPQWEVDPSRFTSVMTVVGQLKIDGILSEDVNDMVGAFIDGECRGVASPAYYARQDAYLLMLNVYGNASDSGKEITYKAFDASAGSVIPTVTPSVRHPFAPDAVAGTVSLPVLLEAVDSREQTMELAGGWNWVSLCVRPYDDDLSAALAPIASAAELIKSKTGVAVTLDDARWDGSLTSVEPGMMYKLKMAAEGRLLLTGERLSAGEVPMTVAPGWNWLGYHGSSYMSLDEAFAPLDPQEGDMLKSRDAVAFYMGYEWVGSLKSLTPGAGYIYRSLAAGTKQFTYPVAARSAAPQLLSSLRAYEEPLTYTPCDEHKYQGNMIMVARVMLDDEVIPCEVAVFDPEDECRAAARSTGADDLVYLTIQGETYGEPLHLRVVYRYEGEQYDVAVPDEVITYENDGIVGTPAAPYELRLTHRATDIPEVAPDAPEADDEYYDLLGRRIKNPAAGGFYIHRRGDGRGTVTPR